jgi:hypothetical protein
MSSQVSSEREVELKYLSLVEKNPPGGVPCLPFYRPREGQAYMRKREEKEKESPLLGAALPSSLVGMPESPSLILVINDTKLLMSYIKWFELGIINTCDESVYGNEWWPQDHKEMVHGHKMTIMVEMHMK